MEAAVAMSPVQRASAMARDGFRLSIDGGAHGGRKGPPRDRAPACRPRPAAARERAPAGDRAGHQLGAPRGRRARSSWPCWWAPSACAWRSRTPARRSSPCMREEDPASDEGWGLFLVDRISDAWGVVEEDRHPARLVRATAHLLSTSTSRRTAGGDLGQRSEVMRPFAGEYRGHEPTAAVQPLHAGAPRPDRRSAHQALQPGARRRHPALGARRRTATSGWSARRRQASLS